VGIGQIGIRQRDDLDLMVADQRFQLGLVVNGDAFGIVGTGQLRRIDPPVNIGNLRRGKGDHANVLAILPMHVEVVEIAAGGPHDEHVLRFAVGHDGKSPGRGRGAPPLLAKNQLRMIEQCRYGAGGTRSGHLRAAIEMIRLHAHARHELLPINPGSRAGGNRRGQSHISI
jgi:hypothetical protein